MVVKNSKWCKYLIWNFPAVSLPRQLGMPFVASGRNMHDIREYGRQRFVFIFKLSLFQTVLKFRELCNRASLIALTGHDKQILQTSEGDSQLSGSCRNNFFRIADVEDNHGKILFISSWLLMKPAGFDCSAEDLEKEVSHIGLPEGITSRPFFAKKISSEHSQELKNIYGKNKNELQEKMKQNILRGAEKLKLKSCPNHTVENWWLTSANSEVSRRPSSTCKNKNARCSKTKLI